MTNQQPPIETTNGTHSATDAEPPLLAGHALLAKNGKSVDERLNALLQTIRAWDWRTGRDEPSAPADASPTPAPPQTATVPTKTREASQPTISDRSPDTLAGRETAVPNYLGADRTTSYRPHPPNTGTPQRIEAVAPAEEKTPSDASSTQVEPHPSPTQQIDIDQTPATDLGQAQDNFDTQPVRIEPVRGSGNVEAPAPHESEDAAAAWFEGVAEFKPEPRSSRRLWSHRRTKVVVVVSLAVAVALVLIIGGIRLTGNSSPGWPATTTARHASTPNSHHRSAHVTPIDSAQLTQYQSYAEGLQKANVSAAQGFANAGSTPTQAVLAPVVAAYRSALDLYRLQVHSMQWPASMQTDVAIDQAQLQTLTSLLAFLSAANPATLNVWMNQLHHDASIVQDTDNQVRHDLGLPPLSSFPT